MISCYSCGRDVHFDLILTPHSTNPLSQIPVSGNLRLILVAFATVYPVNAGKLPFIREKKIKTRRVLEPWRTKV